MNFGEFKGSQHRGFPLSPLSIVLSLFFSAALLLPCQSSLAAVTFRSASSAASPSAASPAITANIGTYGERTSCGSVTPSIPAGNIGDLLIAQVVAREDLATITMPGWNTLFSDNVPGENYQAIIFWRSATGGDPNTISQAGSCNHLMTRITRFGNVDTIQPLETQPLPGGNWVYSDAGDVDTGTQAITVADSVAVLASFVADNRTLTQPGSFTQLYDTSDASSRDAGFSLNYRVEAATGTSGPFLNIDLQANGNDPNHGVLFAVRPAPPGTQLTVPTPAGTLLDDVMIASIAYRPCSNVSGGACTTTITPPAGWTLVRGIDTTTGGGTGGFGSRLLVYQRVATGAEPGSYTWTLGGAPVHAGATGSILSFAGVDTTTPIIAEAGQVTPNAYTHTAPSVNTGTVLDAMLVTSHSVNSSGTWTPPPGMTEAVDISSSPTPDNLGVMLETNYQQLVAAGATGTRTATQSNPPTSDTGGTHTLALLPVDVPPTITSTVGSCSTLTEVVVTFSEDVDIITSEMATNYTLDNGVTISAASRTASNTVTLTTSALTDVTTYILTVNNIEDLAGNAILPNSTSSFSLNCNNLIAFYQLDEASWNGTANEVVDQSGNGLHGAAVGGVTTSEAKVCNGAILDGITLAYVEVADNNLLDIPDELTVSLWMKTNVIPGGGLKTILSKDENYEFHIASGGRINWWWQNSGGGTRQIFTAATVSVGTWHHIAIVYSRSNSSQTIYIDGVPDVNTLSYNESLLLNADPLQIGGDQAFASREFDGLIDEVRIYESALSQTQIQTDMNVTRPCSVPVTCSFRDNFASVSYTNNDGTLSWATNWLEINDNNSPIGGDAYITGGDLVLTNLAGNPSPQVIRELDLSAATSATLEFTFATTAGVDNNDRIQVQVSDNGGGSWTTLETIQNITGASIQNRSYPIDLYMAVNTQIRLQVSAGYTGANESMHFYYVAVLPGGICGGCALDHFIFSTDAAALACPETRAAATITARCADNTVKTDYDGTVDLTTNPTTGSTFYDAATGGNSITSTTYAPADSGVKTVYLYFDNEDTVSIEATDTAPNPDVVSTSSTIDFRAYGLLSDLSNQTSCATTTVTLTAFGRRPGDPGCNVIAGFTGDKNLKAWFGYNNPNSGTLAPVLDHDGGAFPDPATLPTIEPGGNNIMVTFASGLGNFDLTYNDAGLLNLNLKHDDAPYDAPPVDIDSFFSAMVYNDSYVVTPDHFRLRATKTDGTTDLNNITAVGTPIEATGNDFRITAQAVCADNTTITSNYTPTNAQLWIERTGPTVGGSEGTLTFPNLTTPTSYTTSLAASPLWSNVSTSFGNGIIADPTLSFATATFSEVGLITLHLQDTDYFGTTIADNTTPIGRFTPHHYQAQITNGGALNGQCGGNFTYTGQPMGYSTQPTLRITAENSSNNTTQNYTGAFVKLIPADFSFTIPSEDFSQDGTLPGTKMQITTSLTAGVITDNSDGTIIYTLSNSDTYTYDKDGNSMIGAFTSDIRMPLVSVQDSDSVAATSPVPLPTLQPTGASILFGRLEVNSIYGPETLDLVMPINSTYYDGTTFINNPLDTCTSLTNLPAGPPQWGDILLASYTDNLIEGETAPTSVSFANGTGDITLSAPGLGNEGNVDVTIDLTGAGLPWLQYDWDDLDGLGDGPHDDNPSATATFGIYRGNDRIINWREIVR